MLRNKSVRENQRSLTKKNFTIETDANGNEYVAMAVSESTKNHQGGLADKAVDEGDPKMFSTGKSTCPVRYFKKFLAVLHPKQVALFQKHRRNFTSGDQIWFENCSIGVNKIGALMMKEISTDAKLSQVYSNHCVRSTRVTVLEATGIPIHRIMQTSGHRNESSVKSYCDRQTLEKEKESSNILASFGSELPAAQRQRQELEEDNAEQAQIRSEVQNNIVANVNHSPTSNLLQHAEFNNCNITMNIVKNSK